MIVKAMKVAVLVAVLSMALGTGVAVAQTYPPTTPPTTPATTAPPTTTTTDGNAVLNADVSAGQNQGGLPRTGSSSSIPTAIIAVGMVALGTVLIVVARRRSAGSRS